MEAEGDVLGYGAGGDDGNRVVGGAQIGDADQGGDAEFGSPLAADVAGQPGDDEVDASVVADGFEHASGQQGDDDKLAHAGDARSHGSEPVEEGGAGINADNSSGEDAQQQYQHNVDACYGHTQHDEVGDYFYPLDALYLRRGGDGQSLKDIDAQHDKCCRYHNHGVDAELVPHHAVLRLGRCDGGVGYEGKIVAEERASHHDGNHVGQVDARLLRQPHGYGGQCNDSSYAGSYRKGDEAGGNEDARQQQVVRQYVQCQIHGCINGAHLLGALGECSCKDEYPYHQQDVLVAGTCGKLMDALFRTQPARNGDGIAGRGEEGHRDGDFIKVVRQERSHQVEAKEYGQRAERPPAAFVLGDCIGCY